MSVQLNTYVMRGMLFPFDAFAKVDTDVLSPYEDDAYKGVHHKDGLCVLFDGMDGKYVVIGRVIAKTKNHEGFDLPVLAEGLAVTQWDDEIIHALAGLGSRLGLTLSAAGDLPYLRTLVISHYR